MGSIVDHIDEQKEQEAHENLITGIKQQFGFWLEKIERDRSELDFWVWLAHNKDKVARNKKLIDIIG